MTSVDFIEIPEPAPALDHVLVEVARKRREQRDHLVAEHGSVTTTMLADVRDVSDAAARQWLHRHRQAGRLVTVQLQDGTTLIPSFQLDADLEPRPEVAARTARLVDAQMGPWAVWRWWVTHDPILERIPVEALRDGLDERLDAAITRLVDPHG